MKKLIIILFFASSLLSNAQESSKLPLLKLTGIAAEGSMEQLQVKPGTATWKYSHIMYINPIEYLIDIDTYNVKTFYYDDEYDEYSIEGNLRLNASFNLLNKKTGTYNLKNELQIGLSFNYSPRYYASYSYNKSIPKVTFFNSGGVKKVVDSSEYDHLYFSFEFIQLGLSVGYVFRTDPNRCISLFANPNLDIHYSFHSYYNVYREMTTDKIINNGMSITSKDTVYFYSYKTAGYDEFIDIPGSIFIRPNMTYGINFRLSKKVPVLKHFNIYAAIRNGFDFHFYEGKNISTFIANSITTGIRYGF